MKKGVIVILVLLAVVVLVAPALVGRLAERTMDENLNWAAEESGELRVTSENFSRGWFASEGQHRVEVREGQLLSALQAMGNVGDSGDLPVLLITTKIDHGIAQVASGSGKLVSTMQVELPDGQVIDLPGTIYSEVGLTGALDSNYLLEAGSHAMGDASATWGDTDIKFSVDPSSSTAEFDGTVGALSFGGDGEGLSLAGLSFEGAQRKTVYGFNTGTVSFTLSDLSVQSKGPGTGAIRSMSVDATTDLDGDRVRADATMTMDMHSIPQVGEMSLDMDFEVAGASAEAIGRMQQALKNVDASAQDPKLMYAAIEDDLKQLFASGFEMNFERFNVTLPQGTIQMKMLFDFGEDDLATFDWTSLLLTTEALIDISLPATFVEMAGQNNQQLAMAIGGGYLVREGDNYLMKAQLKKGLATINGAPIPIPVGSF